MLSTRKLFSSLFLLLGILSVPASAQLASGTTAGCTASATLNVRESFRAVGVLDKALGYDLRLLLAMESAAVRAADPRTTPRRRMELDVIYQALRDRLDQVATRAAFMRLKLLDGSTDVCLETRSNGILFYDLPEVTASSLGLDCATCSLATQADARATVAVVRGALREVVTERRKAHRVRRAILQ